MSNKSVEKRDALDFLMDALALGSSNAIEKQEADGQTSFVMSDTLPAKTPEEFKQLLISEGGEIGKPVPDDHLFIYVTLPKGWKKCPTEHSMWSNIIDDKGQIRASIFYKAAFYDRDAFLVPEKPIFHKEQSSEADKQ